MAYIGKTPTAAPLTSSDVTDGIITNAKLAQDIISADTALGATPADTDEFLVSDAGVLKRMDYSYIKAGGAWNFIKSQVASNVASVEFKHGTSDVVLDSTYVMYRLIGYDIVAATDDSNLQIQLSTDAGSSYITSGYDTLIRRMRSDAVNQNLTDTASAIILNSLGNDTATEGAAFEWQIFNPSNTKYTRYFFTGLSRDNNSRTAHHNGGGILETAGDVDALKIIQTAGNISGTFKLYGLAGA